MDWKERERERDRDTDGYRPEGKEVEKQKNIFQNTNGDREGERDVEGERRLRRSYIDQERQRAKK